MLVSADLDLLCDSLQPRSDPTANSIPSCLLAGFGRVPPTSILQVLDPQGCLYCGIMVEIINTLKPADEP